MRITTIKYIIQLIIFAPFAIGSIIVLFSPVFEAIKYQDFLYVLLMGISWIPALLILKVWEFIHDIVEEI